MIGDRTKALWFESPINPTLRCVDVEAIAAACRRKGVISIIDNTFASPINQRPLSMGVDIVMHSVTKYLNGHSDVTAGALAGPAALMKQIEGVRRMLGGVVDPRAAYAIGRGLKTLSVRIERHNANAMLVARWLETQKGSRVEEVYYLGLESHPDHGSRSGRCAATAACSATSGRAGAGRAVLRPAESHPGAASSSAVSRACAASPVLTVPVGAYRRAARRRRHHPQHGPAVDRLRRPSGSDRGSGSGALVIRWAALAALVAIWTSLAPRAQLDHIVVGIRSLDEGIAQFESLTGVKAGVGGKHPGRGTENALVSLGGGTYLEILAPQAGAALSPQDQTLRVLERLTIIDWAVSVPEVHRSVAALNSLGFTSSSAHPRVRRPGGASERRDCGR